MGHFVLALFSPLFFACCALAIFAFSSRRKLARVIGLTALAVLLFFSSGAGSDLFVRSLEKPYEGLSVAAAPEADAIVVLGGDLHQRPGAARPVTLGGSGDRLWCGAELYKAGKAPLILLSGGSGGPIPEAIAARRVLEQWGIPPSAILTEDASRDTRQNALFSWRILPNSRILLVTSAWHMRRAGVAFRHVGFTVVPFPADFITGGANDEPLLSLLPNAGALADSGLAIKEWLGLAAYRLSP